MEVELEPPVKPLAFKVKGMSRESPSQKTTNVLDTDLRTHWSTGTNTKEWILLELDEPCLLSHIRIYNKSVLEWEIAVGLRYKPETFVKVRPRCEAPRRDMIYPMNYTPCRYVRISCLRGNPIAIFFIQLIGVSVPGLEPEFQPVVNHLLPQIISHKQDAHDIHLQLLQDVASQLTVFLPQLEADLGNFSDAAESSLRFFAMLVGPFYPILQIVTERETSRSSGNISDSEASKQSQSLSALTVSSNFEPRRSRGVSPFVLSTSSSIAFRPDAIFVLLRKAYKDSDLGTVCRMASRILQKLIDPVAVRDPSTSSTQVLEETSKSELFNPPHMVDYTSLFGEEFQLVNDRWDYRVLNILDVGAVEEGILHVLYACASQPQFCSKLAEGTSDFWSALPLVQALLPALRPYVSSPSDHVDDNLSQWKQAFVQHAASQIVATSSSPLYHSLLHACAGYLSSFSPSHVKAACFLIDLCSGVLAPWMAQVTAKVDLVLELLEDLLGIIQGAHHSISRGRAALKYIVLAVSGHMDDTLSKYKEVKHKILFLLEMLEPFLDPAIYTMKNRIAFGDVSLTFLEKQERNCLIALNIIRTAVRKPAVLPSLESEWKRGSVVPSVLLSVLEPQMQLPPEIDLCKYLSPKSAELESPTVLTPVPRHGGAPKSYLQVDSDVKTEVSDATSKIDVYEDVNLFFVPPELQNIPLTNVCGISNENISDTYLGDVNLKNKHAFLEFANQFQKGLVLDAGFAAEYFNLQADNFHLSNFRDCELRASEFQRLALDLQQHEVSNESHDAAIDALLLAAECYVNPFFLMSFGPSSTIVNQMKVNRTKVSKGYEVSELRRVSEKNHANLETVVHLEKKRDKIVLQILLEAAELDRNYHRKLSDEEKWGSYAEQSDEQVVELSPVDLQSADAVTLVRQNQALLCNFLVKQLQKEQSSMHEILMYCLVFLLHSATKLFCAPENVITIILGSAEHLNGMLTSLYSQGNLQLSPEKKHEIQRKWMLLQRLVTASSGNDAGSDFAANINHGFRHGNLIPPSAWMQRISMFSSSSSPLVRFLGWMAISRNAKEFIKERLFLASDLSELTYLLSIFADELAVVDKVVDQKHEEMKALPLEIKQDSADSNISENADQLHEFQSFRVIYPYLGVFFPNMKKHFQAFGEIILEAVGLHLRSIPSAFLADVLCWFSDLCFWPFFQKERSTLRSPNLLKGYVAKNAKAIILYILEAIVAEHMEAMVPEIPRVMQVLVSLCRASYCDVSFLHSILDLLKPIISYSLCKVYEEEKPLVNDSCLNFESLCFNELFIVMRQREDIQDTSAEKSFSRAMTIYILASVFPDLSLYHRREMLQSLILWADFSAFEPTTSFHDYLCAFQSVMESCKDFLIQILRKFGSFPQHLQLSQFSDFETLIDHRPESESWFLNDLQGIRTNEFSSKPESRSFDTFLSNHRNDHVSADEIESFTKDIESLAVKLFQTFESCWNLHNQLAKKITITSAECFAYSRFLASVAPIIQNAPESISENPLPFNSVDQFLVNGQAGLEGLAETIVTLQEKHCWEVASVMIDCLLGVPPCFHLDNIICYICSAIKMFSCNAPKIAWRIQTDKWLALFFARAFENLNESDVPPLVDLFSTMLAHYEPEQRFIGLHHLGKLIGQNMDEQTVMRFSSCNKLVSPSSDLSATDSVVVLLVSSTWDLVIVLASSDISLPLRRRAMALLVDYIPFANQQQLQTFLGAADNILGGFGKLAHSECEGPFLQLSLALIASACLYSPAEDISLIPQNVWEKIETLASLKTGGRLGDMERKACQVLCRLRNEGDEAKEALREVLSSNSTKQFDPEFGSTRETILHVLSDLTSVQSYFDIFSKEVDQEVMELEEAAMELDIIGKEHALQESSKDFKEACQTPCLASSLKDDNRLQQIRDRIRALEKSKLQEEISARRQKKLRMRRTRQKYLEAAALQEAELLQELDRERAAELEKEIERQRLLELERAKTSELRHQLEMEKERQTQRELQRELEQAESGVRSRRDFSSSHSSRTRDRYRERENGRSGNEGSARTSTGSLQSEITATTSMAAMPTVVLSGSRSFSGQPPTILQSRERIDDCGSSYDENLDGSKDSGDTCSVGDPELVSAFDGHSGGFGSGQRHGARGSKSRQLMERRERDGRREGKWERKHS